MADRKTNHRRKADHHRNFEDDGMSLPVTMSPPYGLFQKERSPREETRRPQTDEVQPHPKPEKMGNFNAADIRQIVGQLLEADYALVGPAAEVARGLLETAPSIQLVNIRGSKINMWYSSLEGYVKLNTPDDFSLYWGVGAGFLAYGYALLDVLERNDVVPKLIDYDGLRAVDIVSNRYIFDLVGMKHRKVVDLLDIVMAATASGNLEPIDFGLFGRVYHYRTMPNGVEKMRRLNLLLKEIEGRADRENWEDAMDYKESRYA